MDIDKKLRQIESLLAKMKDIPRIEIAEPTIFSIGSKGYFENPTTDLLAFFCDDNEAHGLGSLVLEALIQCLPDEYHELDCSLTSSPEREVRTKSGKRIDLLLENQQWVMVLENKIHHQQNNPFNEYEKFIQHENSKRFSGKVQLFVVLSPQGAVKTSHNQWVGISYPTFIEAIKQKLADYFITQPLNKWVVLLREFLLHMESIMSKSSVPQESINFVLENLAEIREAQLLQDKAIKAYQQSLQKELQEDLGTVVVTKLNHWHGFPAIRFAYEKWTTESDVVLFLDGRKDKKFCINYYAAAVENKQQRELADKHFAEQDVVSKWKEVKDTYRCYKAHFDDMSYETIVAKLKHKLRLMDKFEKDVRPALN